ncbi:MAG: carbohydrate porin [Gammaproteobacteria bacterium]
MGEDGETRFKLGGVMAGIYQYQLLDRDDGGRDQGAGGFAFQPELSFRPTAQDELFVKFGFAADNGLNDKTPLSLGTWGGDFEDDVRGIGGRDRDYLLTAWYKRSFEFSESHQLALTGGLVDATDYLDQNVYSKDEYTQFMNPALVNGPNAFLPSYDIGGVVEWLSGPLSLTGVVMNVGENDDGNSFWYYGLQLGYTLATGFGEGNYRVIFSGANERFLNADGTGNESRAALLFSFDQALGDVLGAFVRLGWQDNQAAIDYEAIYSGGLNISGRLWGRAQDDIGIAYGYLEGGNTGIERTQVFEVYARFMLNDYFALTADLQYQDERLEDGGGPKGVIPGLRLTAEF